MKQNFINKVKDGAIKGYEKYNILPSLTIAQAILESGWGKYHIENNLFGIKVGSTWKGKIAIRETKEYKNGKWITIKAKFRAYNSFDGSIEDHAKLLAENKRYAKVLTSKDYKTACNEIYKAGYATDPGYPKKLIQIIEQNKLYEYDNEANRKEVETITTLKRNSRGNEVKKFQEDLNRLGLSVGKVDGIFGQVTEKAVKEFQKIFKLSADGVAGKNTLNTLKKLEKVTHFKLKEFGCRHCGEIRLDVNLLLKLEELRAKTGALIINSGYRCPTHNKNVGGAKSSQHLQGIAADVRSTKMKPAEVYKIADKIFATGGVGKYSTFTHVDVRNGRSRW